MGFSVQRGDLIRIRETIFGEVDQGLVNGEWFTANAGAVATGAEDRFVYGTLNGSLFFDADGSGAGAARLVAIVMGAPAPPPRAKPTADVCPDQREARKNSI